MSNQTGLRVPLGRVGWCAAVLAAAWPCPSPTQSVEGAVPPKGDHGAATMDYQLQVLATLVPKADVSQAPKGFDPVVWAAFVPKDNEPNDKRVALGRKLYFDTRLEAYIVAQRKGEKLDYGKH